jgi:hypothetical protein
LVTPTGAKRWPFKYRMGGREQRLEFDIDPELIPKRRPATDAKPPTSSMSATEYCAG